MLAAVQLTPVHNKMPISIEFVVTEKVVILIGGHGVRKSTKKVQMHCSSSKARKEKPSQIKPVTWPLIITTVTGLKTFIIH